MLHVTCALIEHQGKILICQRSSAMKLPLKWEFPGGKIEPNESKEECLVREISEELGIQISLERALTPVPHTYPDFSITLYPFISKLIEGTPLPKEHAQIKWVKKEDLEAFDWAAADIPIVKEYLQL